VKRSWPFVVWLTLVWVALWEEASAANLLSGLAVAVSSLLLFGRHVPQGAGGRLHPVAAAHFAAYFAWKLVEASALLAWEVVTPRNRIVEGIVAIPVRGVSDTVTTVVANAISLTPGTVTLEVAHDPTVLYVHVLHLHDVEAVRRDVLHLEALAIRAFGSPQAADEARRTADSARSGGTGAPTGHAASSRTPQEGHEP
jgi:multicomponent Na+:H+ antiporter subunit E